MVVGQPCLVCLSRLHGLSSLSLLDAIGCLKVELYYDLLNLIIGMFGLEYYIVGIIVAIGVSIFSAVLLELNGEHCYMKTRNIAVAMGTSQRAISRFILLISRSN